MQTSSKQKVGVWRSDNTSTPRTSRYEDRLDEAGFNSRIAEARLHRKIEVLDAYGITSKLVVYVSKHAGTELFRRGCTSCNELLIDWFRSYLRHVEIQDAVLLCEDYDKFVIYESEWRRFVTFSVRLKHDHYEVLIQSVFYSAWNNHDTFYVPDDIHCFAIRPLTAVVEGVQNIPEMTAR